MSALCLVSTPLAAARAARRLCDAQGGILFGPSVSTLDRIAPGLLAAAGDRRPVLPPLAERLLAAEAGASAGGPYAGIAPEGGLAAALASAIAELREGEVGPLAAREAASSLGGAAAARLSALAAALEAYEDALARLRVLDRAGALRAAAEAARRGASSPETSGLDLLVVDGISAASPAGWDLLASLVARARRTRIHLPFFPERPDVCAPAEPLLRRVEGLHDLAARRDVEVVLPGIDPGRAPRVAALLAAFGRGRSPAAASEGLVLAEPGAGERGEAEAAARVLGRLLDAGFAPDDVALVSPAPRLAGPGLSRACAAAGIPLETGRGRPLSGAPPVQVVLDALGAAGGLDRGGAEGLAASSYLAAGASAGALRSLLDRAGVLDGRTPPAAALRARRSALTAPGARRERDALARAAETIEEMERLLRPLSRPGTAREHAARVAAFLDASGLRRRAARAPREVAARDLAALAALDEALDSVARAVALAGRGGEQMGAGAFRSLLGLAADGAALPPGAEPGAGAVALFGLDDAPGLSARAAVLLGCSRGAWPPSPAHDPVLREPERQALCRTTRRAAVATVAQRSARAVFTAFSAVAAGREAVAFLWPAAGPGGDGGPLAPLAADALAAVGVDAPASPPAEPVLGRARTVREALRAAARAGTPAVAALAGLPLAARAADCLARAAVEAGRREASRARRAEPHCGAVSGPALVALAAVLPAEWAPTHLEEYARCPFRLFLRICAGLDEPGGDGLDLDARDEGRLLHAVLERFVRARTERRAWPPSASDSDLAEARAVAEEVFARFEREGRTGDPAVFAAKREAVLARLDRFVRAEARDHGGLEPALVEHAFGAPSPRPPLSVEADGETVLLRGRMDRVDAGPDRLLVIDYKNARNRKRAYGEMLEPAAFGVTSFQIPAYLLAAARDLPGRRLSATYELLRAAERLEPVEVDPGDPRLAVGPVVGEGVRTFSAGVVETVRKIRRGEFPIASRTCEHCAFGAICRLEGIAAQADAEDAP